jgi:hypothetical protein
MGKRAARGGGTEGTEEGRVAGLGRASSCAPPRAARPRTARQKKE